MVKGLNVISKESGNLVITLIGIRGAQSSVKVLSNFKTLTLDVKNGKILSFLREAEVSLM